MRRQIPLRTICRGSPKALTPVRCFLASSSASMCLFSTIGSSVTCNQHTETYFMSSTFARCCVDKHLDCGFATSCISSSTILSDGGNYTWWNPLLRLEWLAGYHLLRSVLGSGNGEQCAIMTIYDSATTDTPYLDIFCYQDWPSSASEIFRATAITTTSGQKPKANADNIC